MFIFAWFAKKAGASKMDLYFFIFYIKLISLHINGINRI